MNRIYELLSGSIPGGAVLVLAALIFANLTLYFLKKSDLLQKGYAKKSIAVNIIIIFIYSFIWAYTRPPEPPKRIVILPTVTSEQNFDLDARSLQLAGLFQANEYNFDGRFLVHHWQWMYHTLGHKSGDYKNWLELADKFDPYILIKSRFNDQGITLTIIPADSDITSTEIVIKDINDAPEIFKTLETYKIETKDNYKQPLDEKYIECQVLIQQDKLDQAFELVENDSSVFGRLLKAQVWVERGLHFKYDQEKIKFVNVVNPSFEQAKALLYPFIRAKNEPPLVTYLLGRMAVREQKFVDAEIFLKKAFIDQPRNPRIYYLLSFLLPSRLEELGFENRKEILKKAVELDPGYADAVFDLANAYYITGTGAVQGAGTKSAMHEMEKYLYLNDEHPKIMSLLATLYIKTAQYEKAEKIYNTLAERYPDDSNAPYNLGVVFYTRGEYQKALEKFKQAIQIDQNLDAYLYAAMTHEMLGNKELALKYYRDRVRYKKTDDDPFAKEAMFGIRKLREELGLTKQDSVTYE